MRAFLNNHVATIVSVDFFTVPRCASTRLAEKGVPDWVIRAQFGHVSTAMMAVYSHVRRKALDEAAKALEQDVTARRPQRPVPRASNAMGDVTGDVTTGSAAKRKDRLC